MTVVEERTRMRLATVLRWTARVWSISSTLLLVAFALGGREDLRMSASEAVAFLFFPVGVVAGFAMAWRWERAGGLITLGSLVLFYLWMFLRAGRWPTGPYFMLLAAPGLLFTASALLGRPNRPGQGSAPPETHGD